jgi:hypothetical protein
MNERIEAFLQDVLALEGEIWNLSREGVLTSHVGSPCLEYTKAECAQFFAIVDLGHDAPRHDALWQVPARRFRGASGRILAGCGSGYSRGLDTGDGSLERQRGLRSVMPKRRFSKLGHQQQGK